MGERNPNWNGFAVGAFAASVLALGGAAACAGIRSVAVFSSDGDFPVIELAVIGVLALVASVGLFFLGRRRNP